jgi:hypothetical protein
MSGEGKPNGTFSVMSAQEAIREAERTLSRTIRPRLARYKQMYAGLNRPVQANLSQILGGDLDRSRNEDGEAYFDTNYAFMMVDTGRSNVVPGNPQVQILPMADDVDIHRTKTAEALVNHCFRQGKMRRVLGRLNGLTMLQGVSYLKCVYDIQQKTVRYRVVPRLDLFVDPLAETWDQVGYVIEKTTIPMAEIRRRLESGQYTPIDKMTIDQTIEMLKTRANSLMYDHTSGSGGATSSWSDWVGRPSPRDILQEDNQALKKTDVVVVYEVFDLTGDRLWHFAGTGLWPMFVSELPYRLVPNPYIPLVYNDALEGTGGISDLELVEPLISQIHYMSAMSVRHAQACVPRTLVNDDALEDPDGFVADLANAAGPGDVVRVKIANTGKYSELSSIFAHTPQPSLMPEFGTSIQRMEDKLYETLGISPFQRGVVGAGRVATEFALADQANQTRLAERLQCLGDLIEQAARVTLDLYNEYLPHTHRIYLRVQGASQGMVASKETLPFYPGVSVSGSLLISVVPYSPAEVTRETRLNKMLQLLPMLAQMDPEALNTQATMSALVDAAALPPGMLYSQEEKLQRQQVAADAAAEFDAAAGADVPVQTGVPPLAPARGGGGGVSPGRVNAGGQSAATQAQGAPQARGAMVGGAGR